MRTEKSMEVSEPQNNGVAPETSHDQVETASPAVKPARTRARRTAKAAVPVSPNEQEVLALMEIPLLGRYRAVGLVNAGIRNRQDLEMADLATLAAVKGVGPRNAVRIKEWLAAPAAEAPASPAVRQVRVRTSPAPRTTRTTKAAAPALPKERDVLALMEIPLLGRYRAVGLVNAGIRNRQDLELADLAAIAAVKGVGPRNAVRIKEWLAAPGAKVPVSKAPAANTPEVVKAAIPAPIVEIVPEVEIADLGPFEISILDMRGHIATGRLPRKIERQFERLAAVVAGIEKNLLALGNKDKKRVARALDGLVSVIDKAAERKKLSDKRQEKIIEEVRACRKSLAKMIEE